MSSGFGPLRLLGPLELDLSLVLVSPSLKRSIDSSAGKSAELCLHGLVSGEATENSAELCLPSTVSGLESLEGSTQTASSVAKPPMHEVGTDDDVLDVRWVVFVVVVVSDPPTQARVTVVEVGPG